MTGLEGEVRRVSDAILDRIIRGGYPSGLRLPAELALAEQLAVGRSTVREALRHLAGIGLVRSRRGSGAMVMDFRRNGSPSLLPVYLRAGNFDVAPVDLASEMLRIRRWMASEAVRMAASYATPEALAEARERLMAAPALEGDPAAHALNELELYRALVVASRIWPAVWLINAFWAPLREVNAWFAPALGPIPSEFQPTMERVLELIERREGEAAKELVIGWFERVDTQLLAVIEHALSAQEDDQ
jgi:DNA-binding FadR family transcriptional regulator